MNDKIIYKQGIQYSLIYIVFILIIPIIIAVPISVLIYICLSKWINVVIIYIVIIPFSGAIINSYTMHYPLKIVIGDGYMDVYGMFNKYRVNLVDINLLKTMQWFFNTIYVLNIVYRNKRRKLYLNKSLLKGVEGFVSTLK